MFVIYEFGINDIWTKIAGVIFSVTHCLHMCLAQKKPNYHKQYVLMLAVHGALVIYRPNSNFRSVTSNSHNSILNSHC